MDSLFEAYDRFTEWHGTLAPWVHIAENVLLAVPVAFTLWIALCIGAA